MVRKSSPEPEQRRIEPERSVAPPDPARVAEDLYQHVLTHRTTIKYKCKCGNFELEIWIAGDEQRQFPTIEAFVEAKKAVVLKHWEEHLESARHA